MQRVCAFDVNETLLDLAALDPAFTRIFGSARARRDWFQRMLQSAFVATITGAYHDFGAHGNAALTALAAEHGVTLRDEDREVILGTMRRLPAHPEVRDGLSRLARVGVRMVALTNSTAAVAEAQLTNAGIRDLFEQVVSADAVRRLKPAPEPYRLAAERAGVAADALRLIAAHGWDIAGALRAGCAAAFIARPGAWLDPLAPSPDIIGPDLTAVVERIIAADVAGGQRHV